MLSSWAIRGRASISGLTARFPIDRCRVQTEYSFSLLFPPASGESRADRRRQSQSQSQTERETESEVDRARGGAARSMGIHGSTAPLMLPVRRCNLCCSPGAFGKKTGTEVPNWVDKREGEKGVGGSHCGQSMAAKDVLEQSKVPRRQGTDAKSGATTILLAISGQPERMLHARTRSHVRARCVCTDNTSQRATALPYG